MSEMRSVRSRRRETTPRHPTRHGLSLVAILVASVIALVVVAAFQMQSTASLKQTAKTEKRIRARMIAESALSGAAAVIFQNPFENRWYKDGRSAYGGFSGRTTGKYGGGTYEVVAEDVVKGNTDPANEEALAELTYNRIDLFSKGTYEGFSVVVYQALVLMPEEPVYSVQTVGQMREYSIR